MPSSSVVDMLPSWMSVTGKSLHSLTLICKVFSSLSCPRGALCLLVVTYRNRCRPQNQYRPISRACNTFISLAAPRSLIMVYGLYSLSIHPYMVLASKDCPPKFVSRHAEYRSLLTDKVQNMHELARLCSQSPVLHRLRSITLTINQQTPLQTWMADVQQFLAFSPLEVFQIYSTGAFFESPMTYGFWREIINTHGMRLTRFSVHRMLVGLESIQDICRRCSQPRTAVRGC